jgi:Ca2+-binding EF-hand superfamily protein
MAANYSVEELQENNTTKFFVPTVFGTWQCVEGKIVDSIRKAAIPFATATSMEQDDVNENWNIGSTNDGIPSIFLMCVPSKGDELMIVRRDEVDDILMLAGIPTDSECIAFLMSKFRYFFNTNSGDTCITLLVRKEIHLDGLLFICVILQGLLTICSNIQYVIEGNKKRELVDSTKDSFETSSKPKLQTLVLSRTWKLPFPGQSRKVSSYNKIKEEFQKLDVLGEGKLTFLTLKTALQMYDVRIDDKTLRSWISICDQDNKGFVDLKDYVHVHQALVSTYDEDVSRKDQIKMSAAVESRDKAREKLLRIAFDKYDLDQDGLISAEDLMVAAESGLLTDSKIKNKISFTLKDAKEWIRMRDISGQNGVSFDDFYSYYC